MSHLFIDQQVFMNNNSSLKKAILIQNNAAKFQFDWKQLEPVFNKLNEELDELKYAISDNNANDIQSEFGDVLFVMANIARHLDIDPDAALEKTNTKFNNRFKFVLEHLNITDTNHSHSLDAMEQQWQLSKKDYP